MLQFTGSQRVGQDLVTERQQLIVRVTFYRSAHLSESKFLYLSNKNASRFDVMGWTIGLVSNTL